MRLQLDWSPIEPERAREILAQLLDLEDDPRVNRLTVDGRRSPLPFYQHWQLVWLCVDNPKGDTDSVQEDVWALVRDGAAPMLLDGTSEPVHVANADESLELEDAQVPEYIRWFCFAVRAEADKPFTLFEEPPAKIPASKRKAAALAEPLTAKGQGPDGAWHYETTVIFTGQAFTALFAVLPGGEMEMVDDEPLTASFPPAITPTMPPLGIGTVLAANLARLLGPAPASTSTAAGRAGSKARKPTTKRKRGPSIRPTIVELVELLLERALRDQAQNRLLGYFNATLPKASELQRFALVLAGASPIVIVETNIPFVEETISDIANELQAPKSPMSVVRGHVETDGNGQEVLASYGLPNQGPAVVLIPLQVYRRVVQLERLAYELAARDLAAIIACERFADLPESLRRMSDIVLRLPAIDVATFEALFGRVIGQSAPVGWQAEGTEWVKHLLHTDFEHPRRMQLSAADAFAYVHSQVADRLRSVDPVHGLALSELHGLGEAREFAEDLIADIHSAIAGKLDWSQVDRGALLVGPPGTGKTTLAKAIAKACGVKFIQGSAAGWMAEGVSLGPHIAAIRKTFSAARTYAPSILFIDEIDSLGNREQFAGDHNSVYQTEVVNAVLEQMQGLDPAAPVIVIGATNNETSVDPALRRAGRLDRVIRIPRPNCEALDQIYRHYLSALGTTVTIDAKLDLKALGGLSVGLTGADVERIVRGAARRARKAGRPLSQLDVIAEITNKPRGTTTTLRLTPAELESTAIHEAGHALASFLSASKGADIGFVTIVPRDDGTLGFVATVPDERVHLTRRDYEEKLGVWLAGRAAEEVQYGKDGISSGASSDLQSATALAIQMVTQLGLGGGGGLLWSNAPSAADLALANKALVESYSRVVGNLKKHRKQLNALAKELVARQELPGEEVRRILSP